MSPMWSWWPKWRGGDDGPDDVALGHWRGLHEAAVHMQIVLAGKPDARNVYPMAIQMAATLLPALFHATARGDAHAFALALETLDAFESVDVDDRLTSIAWCGSDGLIRPPDQGNGEEKNFWELREIAVARILQLGIRAGIGEAMWEAGRRLWGGGISIADAGRLGFRRRRKGERPVRNPDPVLLMRAAEMGCVEAMPAADTLREQWRLGHGPGSEETAFLSPAERYRRRTGLLNRAWRAIGPLGHGQFLALAAEEWARTGDEEGVLWHLHEQMGRKRTWDRSWRAFAPEEAAEDGRPFRAELARAAGEGGHPVARYFALYNSYDRLPLPAGPALDEFTALCRSGEPLALASLARAVFGDDWRGDAYGPWRIAPEPLGVEDVSAFAEGVFREIAANGGAWGCFYLGQMAWKRAFDQFEAVRARRGAPENRLLYLDRDLRFLELPCEEADLWFRRGAELGGGGADECARTLAWRRASRGVPV